MKPHYRPKAHISLPRLTGQVIAFSRFWLARDVGLLISDAVIELGDRPFAILAALLEAHGRVVSIAELREIVWLGSHVDANTVQAQISAIRRALDDDRDLIVTVARRGYRFAGDARVLDTPDSGFDLAPTISSSLEVPSLASAGKPTTASGFFTHMPTSALPWMRAQTVDPLPFIGRHPELSELLALVPTRRIVTLTGASGIGKTRLAIKATAHKAPYFPDGKF